MAAPWVERSNGNARLLLEVIARTSPEHGSHLGLTECDTGVVDLSPGWSDRRIALLRGALAELSIRRRAEPHPEIRRDLDILIRSAVRDIRGIELSRRFELPYHNLAEEVFTGIHVLLDGQVGPERRPAALTRLRKYAGLEPGFVPIAELAEADSRGAFATPGLIGPYRGEVEKHLSRTHFFIGGLADLFKCFDIEGFEEPLERLTIQLDGYRRFLSDEILSRSRDDYRLPPEIYAHYLDTFGVDVPAGELAVQARRAFRLIQEEMERLAAQVAAEKGFVRNGYREVIRELAAEQLEGERILESYRRRAEEIEEVIRREDLVTLPSTPMAIRLASAAESAAVSAPHMRPPRLIGNSGERGEFVLPLAIPSEEGSTARLTDFTFEAISWTLTAHEGRPGHELQFATMVELGVSIARAVFAFNSVNAEGWALYAESLMLPYLPAEGRLMARQFQLLRAARAFLDPELQAGLIDTEEARRVLVEDVVISEAFASEEIDRYTFFLPGQAVSYFYGFTRLLKLRERIEREAAERFTLRRFHDFILAQGLVPPDLLEEAAAAEFSESGGAERTS